ncbi:MAG: EFR1 family ferrodoxin [Lachnospiraceae bacterium]|nr:EFR1 family ferrodoxin [Lachnospiraceae bacterium]
MIMLYFSGTGNSKYIAKLFSFYMNAKCHSIEEQIDFDKLLSESETIAFCYPVYASRVPRIMREFVSKYLSSLKGKKLIIFCTQMIFSGDGARAFTALFPRGHIKVVYAEHFFMPNNISSAAFVPMASEKLVKFYLRCSQRRMAKALVDIMAGDTKKRGFNILSRTLGLLQAPLLAPTEKMAKNSVKVSDGCNLCGVCVSVCPMQNLSVHSGSITHNHNCTMCCRCVNKCPAKAITIIFHGKVKKQYLFGNGKDAKIGRT